MGISVEYLQSIRFVNLSQNEKLDIKAKGRATPDILIQQSAVSKNKVYIRTFNNEWYDKMKWLCGCDVRNALFCFPCLLFGGDATWTRNGFTDMGRIKDKCEKHQISRKHMENVVSLSLLGQINISGQLNELNTAARTKHNEQVKKNREVLSKMIDCLKFCGDFELVQRVQHQADLPEKPEILKGLIHFIVSMDLCLQKYLDSSPVFRGTSKIFQNELLLHMLEVYQEEVISEIDKTLYVAVLIEEITDLSEEAQLAMVFRYELNGVVHERFWGFLNPESISADDISSCLMKEIQKVLKSCAGKLIAHTYHGNDCIKSEQEGVQQQLQQVFQNAQFVHSYTHHPNVIIKNICSSIESSRLFFANLQGIAGFFTNYPQRLLTLNKYVDPHIPNSWNTHWNFSTRTVGTVYENKDSLIQCFEEMQTLQTTDKIIQASTGFLDLLRNETFLYWLELFYAIMPHVEELYEQMESRHIDGFKIQKALDKFEEAILEIRDANYCESGCACKLTETKEVCDCICEKTRLRFSNSSYLIAAKLFYQENFEYYCEEFPGFEVEETCQQFRDLNQDKLMVELQIFYSRKELHNFNGLLALLNYLHEEDLPNVFTETIKLIKMLVTIPITTSEPNRCFPTIKKIRSSLGSCMDREILTALSMISTEQQMISQIKNFNDRVIEKFCKSKCRRMDFIFK